MTQSIDLKALREIVDKATPGEWGHGTGYCGPYIDYQANEPENTGCYPLSDYNGREPIWLGGSVAEVDRTYIATMNPSLVGRLLRVVEYTILYRQSEEARDPIAHKDNRDWLDAAIKDLCASKGDDHG